MNRLLLIDKIKGITSHDVVDAARRALNIKKIGHTGTLDPLATGLIVLLIGRATKLMKYFKNQDKTYRVTFVLGHETDTLDVTGKTTESFTDGMLPASDDVKKTARSFLGEHMQRPPAYSAIKVNGRRSYELARKNKQVTLKKRPVTVYEISDFQSTDAMTYQLTMRVSSGTYVRSFVRDVGRELGCYATMTDLRRLRVDGMNVDDAIESDAIDGNHTHGIDPFSVLDLPEIILPDDHRKRVRNGGFLDVSWFESTKDTVIRDQEGRAMAVYRYDDNKDVMRPSVML